MDDNTLEVTEYAGIDYSCGLSNRDVETGIHYGIISANSLPYIWDTVEPDYGNATCPKCGNDATDYDTVDKKLLSEKDYDLTMDDLEDFKRAPHDCDDYVCFGCEYVFGSESAFSDEPLGYTYDDNGYSLSSCFDNTEFFVLKSPYYTYAQYCSPCVPGAGNLDTPCSDNGPKTYCLDKSWYENETAPYVYYLVSDDSRVE